ncbi:MAG: hypothetical protein ACFFCM_03465 [Promethearchaeota archaeon]
MERRKIRREEEKERERKKKELKKSFRKSDKDKVRVGLSKLTAAKIIIILAIIITPIAIFFAYQYFETEKEPQYSFLTEGDHVYGTWLNGNNLNFTYIESHMSFASTAQYMSMEITDDYPYDIKLYKAELKSTFPSVLSIPYDVHPHDHHEDPDCYVEFMFAFLHNVPDLFYVLRSTDEVIYPAVLEWYYILNGTDLEDENQQNFFQKPEITVEEPSGISNGELKLNEETEIRVNVSIKAGIFYSLGLTEMTMVFRDSENFSFKNASVAFGGLGGGPGRYNLIARRSSVATFTSMNLVFNITVKANQTFSTQNILNLGTLSFQIPGKLLQSIYPTKGFGSVKYNVIGIPDEDQIEAFIYMIRQKYVNFHIDLPLFFSCTVTG